MGEPVQPVRDLMKTARGIPAPSYRSQLSSGGLASTTPLMWISPSMISTVSPGRPMSRLT
jgi:hypothetical protein